MASATHGAEIQRALAGVRASIATLAQKHALKRQPLLVAASKTKPTEAILHAYAAGQRHFGENYVQELTDKAALPVLSPAACPGLVWHFIGHLQSNKVKQVARIPNLALVECIDSSKLASALDKACTAVRADALTNPLGVLIQVNTSGEKSKFGCEPAEASALFEHVLRACPALEPRGLMTIGRLAEGPQPDCFDTLVRLRDEICAKFGKPTSDAAAAAASESAAAALSSAATRTVDPARFELSMGMSGDYALALEKGATEVRVGTSIFGAREYPVNPWDEATNREEASTAPTAAAAPQ